LLRHVERLGDSIDFLQIRERDLSPRELAAITRAVLRAAHPRVRVLVNDDAGVAVACGAHGLHLRSNSIAPDRLREILPPAFLISVACHSVSDVVRAEQEGADVALLAPILETPGKGPPLGLVALERAATSVRLPVLALGGITEADIPFCMSAGAAGVAGIRLFMD
jgi:thiamine-phosphate pyrophosphorylase